MFTFPHGYLKAASGGSSVLLYDTFEDASGTLLADHTPDTPVSGSSWVLQDGGLEIGSNRLVSTAGLAVSAYRVGIADLTGSMIVNFSNTSGPYTSYYPRYLNGVNYWQVLVEYNTSRIKIYERTGSSPVNRAETNISIAHSTDYLIEVSMNGSTISGDINGYNVAYSSVSTHATSEYIAVAISDTGSAVVDDFTVYGT